MYRRSICPVRFPTAGPGINWYARDSIDTVIDFLEISVMSSRINSSVANKVLMILGLVVAVVLQLILLACPVPVLQECCLLFPSIIRKLIV